MTDEERTIVSEARGALQSAHNSKSATRRKLKKKIEVLDAELAGIDAKIQALDAELAKAAAS